MKLDFRRTIDIVNRLKISAAECAAICEGNARRLLKLPAGI